MKKRLSYVLIIITEHIVVFTTEQYQSVSQVPLFWSEFSENYYYMDQIIIDTQAKLTK